MNISGKHQNETMTMLQSFVGGMNTSAPPELIDETQLANVVNMEIDASGLLRTVKGTEDIKSMPSTASDIKAAAYDSINNVLLLFCKDKTVYALIDGTLHNLGYLTGDEEPITVAWEDGLLIASGGWLQYAKYVVNDSNAVNDETRIYKLVNITSSKPNSNGVFVRSGRVFCFDDQDNLYYSAVGDEEAWESDTNDPSTAIFTQIGYKVGGKIIGLINFQSYVLIIKDNGKIFRLSNEYPDWDLKEVTSNGVCKGRAAYASIGSGVFVLGDKILQAISPTDDYGNMPINQIGKQISHLIESLPPKTKMRFVVDLNQLWFVTGSQWVLVYDCITQTFFQRYFNSVVVDVVGDLVIKKNKVCRLVDNQSILKDNNVNLEYRAKFKTEMSIHDILVKSVNISLNPLISFYDNTQTVLKVGRIQTSFPIRTKVTNNVEKSVVGVTQTALEQARSQTTSTEDLFLNMENISAGKSILYKKKQVCRCRKVDVELSGSGFPFILNYICYSKVEV